MATWAQDADRALWEDEAETLSGSTSPIFITAAADTTRRHCAYQFDSCPIPQGSTINTCVFQVELTGGFDDVDCEIHVEDADAPVSLVDVINISRTTASTTWSQDNMGASSDQTTPDFASALQEQVNRPGYANGNRVTVIFWAASGSTDQLRIQTAGAGTPAPNISVDYTVPAVGGSTSPNALRINASRGNLGTNMTTR